MSQQPSQFSQQPQQTARQGQRNRGQFARDPASGRFLTRPEQAYVEQLAQQYPQQVQQAYQQNVPFTAVGIPAPPNLGDPGTQVGQGMQSQQMPQTQGMGGSSQPMGQQSSQPMGQTSQQPMGQESQQLRGQQGTSQQPIGQQGQYQQ